MLTVYSAIYGGRDIFHPPKWSGAGVAFVLYTDDPSLRGRPGVIVDMQPKYKPPLMARWHKTHPPDGDSLWIDGIYQLIADPRPLLAGITTDVGLRPHPKHACLYHEAIKCAARKKDKPRRILRQAMRYITDGYPSVKGLWMGGMIYRPASSPREWQDLWWDEIRQGSCRDQISLPYALWKTGATVSELPPLNTILKERPHVIELESIK